MPDQHSSDEPQPGAGCARDACGFGCARKRIDMRLLACSLCHRELYLYLCVDRLQAAAQPADGRIHHRILRRQAGIISPHFTPQCLDINSSAVTGGDSVEQGIRFLLQRYFFPRQYVCSALVCSSRSPYSSIEGGAPERLSRRDSALTRAMSASSSGGCRDGRLPTIKSHHLLINCAEVAEHDDAGHWCFKRF